eukprot:7140263-Ditylum_brightwellii.AAC.1
MERLESKAIPQPQLLIKDHKNARSDGAFLTRVVIPATNVTVTLSKIRYMRIKENLDEHRSIIQSIQLSKNLKLTADKITLMLLDINNMYPSIK